MLEWWRGGALASRVCVLLAMDALRPTRFYPTGRALERVVQRRRLREADVTRFQNVDPRWDDVLE